jgi:methylated-DNA-[protein]-cysteine S-methyltransferase
MTHFFSTFATPFGNFSVAVDETGSVTATAFGDDVHLKNILGERQLIVDDRKTAFAREQLLAYFSGKRREFDLPLAPAGTFFQRRVWAALQKIPFGETRSYGEIARQIGGFSRAVGRANGTNSICVIIPCHRVIGADGSLTGFAFGTDLKRRLLEHEGALTPSLL